MHIHGFPVYVSNVALEKTEVPARIHVEKYWHEGRAYHARIQKKWIKRFGFYSKPAIFKTPHGFFVHPNLMPELRAALAQERT